jgi:methylated-DNA-[protein]-cysteine S-methyltransferase
MPGSAVSAARRHTVIDSPYQPLTLVAEEDRLVGLYLENQRHRPAEVTFGVRVPEASEPPFAQAASQLDEYFTGRRRVFELPLTLHGTAFQQRVWAALLEIPYGQTRSYGELAEHLGRPTAARAVGLANGRNPIGVIVPCHRLVAADGGLVGYGGGIDRKQALLAHEGVPPRPQPRRYRVRSEPESD